MKKIFSKTLVCLLLSANALQAQKPQEVKMPITQVNVYLNAAQITHSQKLRIKPGVSKIAFTGLAMNIEKEHISLRNLGGAQLLALNLFKITENTEVSSLNEDIIASLGKAKDSLTSLEKSINRVYNDIQGLELEKRMLWIFRVNRPHFCA